MTNRQRPCAPSTPLHEIAAAIVDDFVVANRAMSYELAACVDAMPDLTHLHEPYLAERSSSVVACFMGSASSWRGERARRLKAELRGALKQHDACLDV